MAKPNYSPPINTPYAITSYFWKRSDGFHQGLDLAPRGNHDYLLRYMTKSRVIEAGYHPVSGYFVWYEADIWDGRKWKILYAHMAHPSPNKVGDRVDVGQWAGTVGSTGNSTGRHLHIEIVADYGNGYMRIDPKLAMEQMELIDKIGKWK